MIAGVSYGELGFVGILLFLVVLSQVVGPIGEAIGARYEKKQASKEDASHDGAASGPKPRAPAEP